MVGPYVYSLALGMSVSDISGKAIANLATEELSHPAPVFHGDTLFAETEVLEVRESRSKPDRGTVKVHTRVLNQDGVLVAEFKRLVLVPKREARRLAVGASRRRVAATTRSGRARTAGRSRRRRRGATSRISGVALGPSRRAAEAGADRTSTAAVVAGMTLREKHGRQPCARALSNPWRDLGVYWMRDRRADGHQPREAQDRGVAQADAAVADPAGDQVGAVRAVDADEAAAGPVGERRRIARSCRTRAARRTALR